jgi:pimeloyl-ACP methyl ester carboxylesterase
MAMTDFVLVHGAWGGGWSYDRLARELKDRGHRVVVAQLKGLGTRREELHGGITLSDHVGDVVAQVEKAGFKRFVLCGHSYGGMVISGVAAKLGAQIDALVYIDAFLPGDGQSLWDITGEFEHKHYIDSQKDTPGLVGPIMGALSEKVGRHPLLTLLEAVRYSGEEAKIPRHIYVFANNWQPTPFVRFRNQVIGEGRWELHELKSGHDVMADQPEWLLKIVLGCV